MSKRKSVEQRIQDTMNQLEQLEQSRFIESRLNEFIEQLRGEVDNIRYTNEFRGYETEPMTDDSGNVYYTPRAGSWMYSTDVDRIRNYMVERKLDGEPVEYHKPVYEKVERDLSESWCTEDRRKLAGYERLVKLLETLEY